MKDSFFEILLNLFERTIKELNKTSRSPKNDLESEVQNNNLKVLQLKAPLPNSHRVFTDIERLRLTKPSQQFLLRLKNLQILDGEIFENILNHLSFSPSPYIYLDETKWVIRRCLEDSLSNEQLAFLDLILYQKEDGYILN